MNVIGSRGDGWWLDRDAAVLRLLSRIEGSEELAREEVTVVLDGRVPAAVAEMEWDRVSVLEAGRRGRNAADHRIVELVSADPRPWTLTVVTSDRALRERVGALGAQVVGSGSFLRLLHDRRRVSGG